MTEEREQTLLRLRTLVREMVETQCLLDVTVDELRQAQHQMRCCVGQLRGLEGKVRTLADQTAQLQNRYANAVKVLTEKL